jgi:hypothetical protein
MIRECEMLGSVSGSMAVGGIAGRANRTTIVDCRQSEGNVTSATNNAGGIVGHAIRSYILRCYSDGNIRSVGRSVTKKNGRIQLKDGKNVGGIVGRGFTSVTIRACIALNPEV